MSDLSTTVRSMKFMQRTSIPRKKTLKTSSTTMLSNQSISSSTAADHVVTTPDHPGCWRIIKDHTTISTETTTPTGNQPLINYCNSVFSVYGRHYTRLSFQNYNKRIQSLMIKYGVKQDVHSLEDGEIDASDNDDNEKMSVEDDTESKHVTTLGKTISKKFNRKTLPRPQFDNKTRITKRRRRRALPKNSTD